MTIWLSSSSARTRTGRRTWAERLAAAVFRLIWHAYPEPFRGEYRDQALVDLARQTHRRREQGRSRARFWLRALVDLVRSVVGMRRRSPEDRLQLPDRAGGGASSLTAFRDDFFSAYRSLRQNPGFALLAIGILALGVGGSTAVFSLLESVLLRPLPYAAPDRLAVLWSWDERRDLPDGSSYANSADWQARSQSFEDMALYLRPEFSDATLGSTDPPTRAHVGIVTSNLFALLGVAPQRGRVFSDEEEAGGEAVALISDSFWRQDLGAVEDVLGTTLEIDGTAYAIVGVMPPGFLFPRPETRLWIPLGTATGGPAEESSRRIDSYVGLGRLRPGITFAAAQSDLDAVARQLAAEYPDTNRDLGVRVRPLLLEMTGPALPRALWMLFGATVFVLLIAATNVAHLTLARGAGRRRELAIRSAVGASGARLARQQVAESVLLAVLAAGGGAAIGALTLRALVAVAPAATPRLDAVGLDARVLLGSLAVTLLLGLGFALVPAVVAARSDPGEAMREGARGLESATRKRFRSVLVIGQVALAMMLLAGASLLLRSLSVARAEGSGFGSRQLVRARLDLPRTSYTERAQIRDFHRLLSERLEGQQGIRRVGAIQSLFISRIPDLTMATEGFEGNELPAAPATADFVAPGFFDAVGSRLVRGRVFEVADMESDDWARLFVINETAAATFWPGQDDVVGSRFHWPDQSPDAPWNRVIGVVADAKRRGLDQRPLAQLFMPGIFHAADVVVDGTDADATIAAIRQAIAELDSSVPISQLARVHDVFGQSLAPRRFQSLLLGGFALLAALLASAGLFGLLHESVTQRRRELGIRLALGAEPRDLVTMVLRHAGALTGAGVLLGCVGAYAAAGVVSSLLYGVAPTDSGVLVAVALLLVLVGLIAAVVPARRVTQIQTTESLIKG